jgi:hypothetical protein
MFLLTRHHVFLGQEYVKFLRFWVKHLVLQPEITEENLARTSLSVARNFQSNQVVRNYLNPRSSCYHRVSIVLW